MKKILLVNNNLQMGGIQKSLINLIQHLYKDYELTLLLFAPYGVLLNQVPPSVKIIYSSKVFRTLGYPWKVTKKNVLTLLTKIFTVWLNAVIGKNNTFNFLSLFQKKIKGFDVVISFSQCTDSKIFSICCPEFVLHCTECSLKICYIHNDYPNSGTVSDYNNAIYQQFNRIACCSNSVKTAFLSVLPELSDRCYTVRNFIDENIYHKALIEPIIFDNQTINIISCARLSREKGISRAVDAIVNSGRKDLRYFIIGDGPDKMALIKQINENNVNDVIKMLGEQENPYKFMKNADYIFVPSFHEAAPMVYDEAGALNIRIISTETTSAYEMLNEEDIICENSYSGLLKTIRNIKKPKKAKQKKMFSRQRIQFIRLIEDSCIVSNVIIDGKND